MDNPIISNIWQQEFIDYLNQRGLTPRWQRECIRTISRLNRHLATKTITDLNKLNAKDLLDFQEHLYKILHLSYATVHIKVVVLKSLFSYLYHRNLILVNPAHKLVLLPAPGTDSSTSRRYYNWRELKRRWLNQLRKSGLTRRAVKRKELSLNQFINYLKTQGIKSVYKIRSEHIGQYPRYLSEYRLPDGGGYREFCILLRLRHLDQFFRHLRYDYSIQLELPPGIFDPLRYQQLLKEQQNEHKKKLLLSSPANAATALETLTEKYVAWRRQYGYRDGYRRELRKFLLFLQGRGIKELPLVTKQDILYYQHYLYQCRTAQGVSFRVKTVNTYLVPVFTMFKFLAVYDFIDKNPCVNLVYPREERGLPRTLMTLNTVGKLLHTPDSLTCTGLRDRAIMEVFYSTGMRASELSHLVAEDIDFSSGTVRVNHPKGGASRQRVIPIGQVACDWVKRYLNSSRVLLNLKNEPYLFLSTRGNRLISVVLNDIVKRHCFRAGLNKNITSHSFRVTCATLMLKNGADIRYVQEQLGHRSIVSTQVYTRLIPYDLKRIHRRYHPRERDNKIGEKALPKR